MQRARLLTTSMFVRRIACACHLSLICMVPVKLFVWVRPIGRHCVSMLLATLGLVALIWPWTLQWATTHDTDYSWLVLGRLFLFILCSGIGLLFLWWAAYRYKLVWEFFWRIPRGRRVIPPHRSFDTILGAVATNASIVFVLFWITTTTPGWTITPDGYWSAFFQTAMAAIALSLICLGLIVLRVSKKVVNQQAGKKELSLGGRAVAFFLAFCCLLVLGMLVSLTGGLISPFTFIFALFVSVAATATERLFYPWTVLILCVFTVGSTLFDGHPNLSELPGFSKVHLATFVASLLSVAGADSFRNTPARRRK